MTWDEFCDLLSGISPDSPIGRIAQIRLETDKKIIEKFTTSQKKIWSEWQSRKAKHVSQEETMNYIESIKQAFINMTK